jgi:hypothetical protein
MILDFFLVLADLAFQLGKHEIDRCHPHSLSIVKESDLPRTTAEMESCKVCKLIKPKHVGDPTMPAGLTGEPPFEAVRSSRTSSGFRRRTAAPARKAVSPASITTRTSMPACSGRRRDSQQSAMAQHSFRNCCSTLLRLARPSSFHLLDTVTLCA